MSGGSQNHRQVLVRSIRGPVSVVEASDSSETLFDFCKRIQLQVEGIDSNELEVSLFHGRHCLVPAQLEQTTVGDAGLEHGTLLQTMLCIAGGKGGFGSNLRAAGKLKLVDNIDACRDLQGRRVRQKTALEKLEKWKEEEDERELENIALKHLKEVERKNRRGVEIEVDVQNVRKEKKKTLQDVKSAVSEGLARDGGSKAREKEEDDPDQSVQKMIPSKFALFDEDESEYSSSDDE
eukprot:jgi/Picsp_1/3141/NSC_05981-R1_protein